METEIRFYYAIENKDDIINYLKNGREIADYNKSKQLKDERDLKIRRHT